MAEDEPDGAWAEPAVETAEADDEERQAPGHRSQRHAALRRMLEAERTMDRTMARAARRIRRRLEADASLDPAAVAREELLRVLPRRVRIVRSMVDDVAGAARKAHLAEAGRIVDIGPSVVAMLEEADWTSPAAEIVRGRFDVRGRSLARRLAEIDADVARRMADQLTAARRAGNGALEAAKRLRAVAAEDLQRAAPQYIEELVAAAEEAPSTSAVRAIVRRFRRRMLRSGVGGAPSVAGTPFSVRGATRTLLAQLERGQGADLGAAVRGWVEQRALRRARLIARTEGARAFHEGYMRIAQQNPHVQALRWNLSRSHPKADICDLLAGQDLFGHGAGVYRPDAMPSSPAHPGCICFPTALMPRARGRRLRQGEPRTASEWLGRQSKRKRREILGPTRARLFEDSPDAVVTTTGQIRTVVEAQRLA